MQCKKSYDKRGDQEETCERSGREKEAEGSEEAWECCMDDDEKRDRVAVTCTCPRARSAGRSGRACCATRAAPSRRRRMRRSSA